jgi:hypothetical protein
VIAEETGRVWRIEPSFHLIRRLGGIRHSCIEVVEVISQQEETVMRFALDDLVGALYFFMDIGDDQPTRFFPRIG